MSFHPLALCHRSSAESTEEPPLEQPQPAQQPTVIQAEQGGDDLLIGDLLSMDIPTGPAVVAPGGGGGGGGLGDLDLLSADLGGLGVSKN